MRCRRSASRSSSCSGPAGRSCPSASWSARSRARTCRAPRRVGLMAAIDALSGFDVALVRAGNPSPLTLEGTNTWLVGRDPCWVVDPGPDLDGHVAAVLAEGAARGGIAGLAVTHAHADHSGAVHGLVDALGGHDAVDVRAIALGGASVVRDGDRLGPLEAIAVPGHAPDHLCF